MRTRLLINLVGMTALVGLAAIALHRPVTLLQAQGSCAVAPVNVQFRTSAAAETPWVDGAGMTNIQVGNQIDVNCFAQSGASLLSGGRITAVRNYQGQNYTVSLPTASNQLRDLTLSQPGTYTFTCANTAGNCSNADTLVVSGAAQSSPSPTPSLAASPSPSAAASPSPSPAGNTGSVSCVNLTMADGMCPMPGQSVRFRCQGSPGADYYFFAYRQSPLSEFVELSRGPENLSAPVDTSLWFQVQCNACKGTTCSSSESVNQNCTISMPSSTSGGVSPADINRDGDVNIDDYRDFLRAYLEWIKGRG